jgi:hypothetical protein
MRYGAVHFACALYRYSNPWHEHKESDGRLPMRRSYFFRSQATLPKECVIHSVAV